MNCNCNRNNCNNCGPIPDCNPCNDNCTRVEYVPGTACTIAITSDGCTTTFNLHDGVKACETDTRLWFDRATACINLEAERHTDTICLCEMLESVELGCLGDVDFEKLRPCDIPVFDPYCDGPCADCADDRTGKWVNYHIPDAGDCVMSADDDGYYKVLAKNECGCIIECRVPIVPKDGSRIAQLRDSTPDDPDFPWYYGCYNENKIPLLLKQICPEYFGKFDLEILVTYGVQVVRSDASPNANFRSLVVPYAEGETVDKHIIERRASILQDDVSVIAAKKEEEGMDDKQSIPWGSKSMRGVLQMIVPKGKEAYLRHEFRLRTMSSFPNYATNDLDGQRVPDEDAAVVDKMKYVASRLNALVVTVRPASGNIIDLTEKTTKPAKMEKVDDIVPALKEASEEE